MPEEIPRWKQRFADNREARAWNLTSLLMTLPLLVVGSYYYGAHVLRNAVAAALAAALCEAVAARLILRRRTIDDWNAVVTGVWIACMLPAQVNSTFAAPVYAAVGAVFAVLVVKIPFGGTMHAPFTPAAAGLAFLTVCFPLTVFNYMPSTLVPPPYGASLASMLQHGRSVMGSRQLSVILLGQSAGPMGAGCILLLAAALVAMLLLEKRRSAAMASVGFLAAVAVVSFLLPRVTGDGCLDQAGYVDAGVERLHEQQGYDDDLVVARLDELVDHCRKGRLGQLEERLLDAQVWPQRLDLVDEGAHGCGRAGVTAAVSQRHQCGCGHRVCLLPVRCGFHIRSCSCRPSVRCAGPRRPRPCGCTARSRSTDSRRTPAG